MLPDGSEETRFVACEGESVEVHVWKHANAADPGSGSEQGGEEPSAVPTVAQFRALYTKAVANAAAARCPALQPRALSLPREALVLRVGGNAGQAVACDLGAANAERWSAWVGLVVRATEAAPGQAEEPVVWPFEAEYWRDELRYAGRGPKR